MWPCFNIFSTYPHPKTRTIKKHTHGKNPSLPVNGVENPESFCWGRDGWISPPCLVGFPQLRNPKKRDNHPIWITQYGSNWVGEKTTSVGLFFYGWVCFVCGFLLSICGRVSYLDNFVSAPDFDRRHPSGTMVGNCWDVFLGRGFEHHLLSLIFPQRTGFWSSKKWKIIRANMWEKKTSDLKMKKTI